MPSDPGFALMQPCSSSVFAGAEARPMVAGADLGAAHFNVNKTRRFSRCLNRRTS